MPIDASTQLDLNDVVVALQGRIDQLERDLIVARAYVSQVERERDEAKHVAETLTAQLGVTPSENGEYPDLPNPHGEPEHNNGRRRRAAKKAPAKRATPSRKGRATK
jgi:hypothetical protein